MAQKTSVESASSSIRYIPCKAEPGMFRDELLVYVIGLNPQQTGETIKVQLLVDQNEVKHLIGKPKRYEPATGWLQVNVANEFNGVAEVVLPQPAQPVGESMLVYMDDLKEAIDV